MLLIIKGGVPLREQLSRNRSSVYRWWNLGRTGGEKDGVAIAESDLLEGRRGGKAMMTPHVQKKVCQANHLASCRLKAINDWVADGNAVVATHQ